MQIENKTVLLTGANRGLGGALLADLLQRGVKKVYAGTRTPLTHADARVVPLALDITDPAQIRAAAERATDVDLLINNAGVNTAWRLLECDPAALQHDFAVNFHGAVSVMRAFAPVLVANAESAMLNILSVAAFAPMPMMGGYAASKAAQWSAVQSLRNQLRDKRVHVHAAFPGAIDTDMMKDFDIPKSSPDDIARNVLDGVAAGTEDIGPDGMSSELLALYARDPRAAKQFLGSLL